MGEAFPQTIIMHPEKRKKEKKSAYQKYHSLLRLDFQQRQPNSYLFMQFRLEMNKEYNHSLDKGRKMVVPV